MVYLPYIYHTNQPNVGNIPYMDLMSDLAPSETLISEKANCGWLKRQHNSTERIHQRCIISHVTCT